MRNSEFSYRKPNAESQTPLNLKPYTLCLQLYTVYSITQTIYQHLSLLLDLDILPAYTDERI